MTDGEPSHSRDHARHPIELKVEYKRLNAFFADYTKNISKGGTFIRTDKPLDVGTEFVFELRMPRVAQPLRITGKVQWVLTDADAEHEPRGPGMGIRFMYRDDAERAEIERQIEKIMIDSLGQRLYSRLMEHSRGEAEHEQDSALASALGNLGAASPGAAEE